VGSALVFVLPAGLMFWASALVAGVDDAKDAAITTRIAAQAHVAKAALKSAQVQFTCTTGKGGALSVAVVLPEPDVVTTFPLEDFEGPDGIGETRPLATWSVAGSKPTTVMGRISGWRGVDGDGFLLASSRVSTRTSDLARLLQRWLDANNEPLRLVVDPPRQGAALEVEATSGDRHAVVAAVLAPCLATVK
jgi:hypothetical protein